MIHEIVRIILKNKGENWNSNFSLTDFLTKFFHSRFQISDLFCSFCENCDFVLANRNSRRLSDMLGMTHLLLRAKTVR